VIAQENKHAGEEGQDLLLIVDEEENTKHRSSMVVARGIVGTVEMYRKGI
jgi:hypothetical protein